MKFVLLGLGNIGTKRLALVGDQCVAIVDPYNRKATYRDIRECDPKSYEAVILSVPNKVKLELIRQCLEMGKHVLVEKPLLFSDQETAHELNRIARQNKVIWYTSYNHRFEPLIEEIKKEIDEGFLGKIYHGRLFYGNGTVGNVVGSWREDGLGVLEDLGSHLLDLTGYLLGCSGSKIKPWSLKKYASNSLDHCIVATEDERFVLEMSFLSWKNNFEIELYGEKGSLHLKGLCKWGPSELVLYERILPSGIPKERRKILTGPDITWEKDLQYFEDQVGKGQTSMQNDWWISKSLHEVAQVLNL